MQHSKLFGNSYITKRNNGIYLDEISVWDLVKKYRTPVFFYLKNRIIENINNFTQISDSIFSSSQLYYSVKSNYYKDVITTIGQQNIPFEIVSEYELDIVMESNQNMDNLLIGGPYLSDELILKSLKLKDPLLVAYSINDMVRINEFGKKFEKRIKILIRFSSPKANAHLGIRYDEKYLKLLENSCFDHLDILGVLSHYGTQMNTENVFQANAEYLATISKKLENMGILNPKYFDFGGGFPVALAYKSDQLKETLNLIKNTIESEGFKDPTYIFELGRYIIGDAGCCLMKVINRPEYPNGQDSIYVNAGNHILPRFAKNPIRFYNLNAGLDHYNKPITIYGIVLSEEDILVKNYNFSPNTKIGDYILATNCGAYSFTFSNRFPYYEPENIMIEGTMLKTMEK